MTVRITGIAGSLRRESFNRKLQHAAAHEMPHGAELTVWDGLGGVPPLSAYLSGHGSMINGNAFSWRATPGRPPGFRITKTPEAACVQATVSEWPSRPDVAAVAAITERD
jgi:hypothetical protein